MKRAVIGLAVVLILLSVCSYIFFKPKPISKTGQVSSKMVSEVQRIFTLIPKDTTFTVQHVKSKQGYSDLVLFSADLKQEINLTKQIHKLNKEFVYIFSNDYTKLMVRYTDYIATGFLDFTQIHHLLIFDKTGAVLYQDQLEVASNGHYSYFYQYSDDFNYVVYSDWDVPSNPVYLTNTVTKEKKRIFEGSVSYIDSDYICSIFGYPSAARVYEIKTGQLTDIKDCYNITDIKNGIAVIEYNDNYYDYNLKTGTRTIRK